MELPGYLQLDDPSSGCVVLLDNKMTAELTKARPECGWKFNDAECDECACPGATCGVTDPCATPWYTPRNDASLDFLGLYGSLSITQPPAETIRTGYASTQVASPKRLTFTGVLAACSEAGAAFGHQWIAQQLEPLCKPCSGRSATVFNFCPDVCPPYSCTTSCPDDLADQYVGSCVNCGPDCSHQLANQYFGACVNCGTDCGNALAMQYASACVKCAPVDCPPEDLATIYGVGPCINCETQGVIDGGCRVDWQQTIGLDGCTDPALLGPNYDPGVIVDNGQRSLLKVRYMPASFQELEQDMPTCFGMRVTFGFEIQSGDAYRPPTGGCVLSGPDSDVRPCCVPLSWEMEPDPDDCGCVTPCACNPVLDVGLPGSWNTLPDGAAECAYSTPLCSETYAMLLGPFPDEYARPIIRLTAGSTPLENVSVWIWEAVEGLPSPMTPLGQEIYGNGRAPEVEPALIRLVGANSSVVLDGRDRTETAYCPGSAPQPAIVSGCGGSRYQHARLCCGKRYWVAVEVPCDTPGDWTMHVDYAPESRV